MEGLAAPIRSITLRLIKDAIRSGEVNRPTATTGFVVMLFTNSI